MTLLTHLRFLFESVGPQFHSGRFSDSGSNSVFYNFVQCCLTEPFVYMSYCSTAEMKFESCIVIECGNGFGEVFSLGDPSE